MRTTFILLLIILVSARPVDGALPPLERLTPQNLHRLEQVGLIRRGTVEEMAWSPDEAKLAVVGSAGLRVYAVESGREQLLLGHRGGVNDVDFSPDGREIASAGDDGTLRIWDSATGQLLRSLNPYADLTCACDYHLASAKYSDDGTRLWVGAGNGPLRVIDATSGAVIAQDDRRVLEIMPDAARSRFAISEQRSAHLTIWPSSGPFAPVRDLDMRFTVWNASFVPETRHILVAGFVGARLALVDTDTSETVDMVRGSRVLHVGTSGSMVTQVIDWFDGARRISLRVSDVDSGALQFNMAIPAELTDARFSPSGDRVAVSDSLGALTIWDWRRNLRLLDVAPQGTALIGLALLDNGLVASIDGGVGIVQSLTREDVSSGGIVRLWDILSGREVGAFETAEYGLASADTLFWDPRIRRLIIGSTTDPDIQLELDPATGSINSISQYNVILLADDQYVDANPDGLLGAEALNNDDVRVTESAEARNAVTLRESGPALRFDAGGTLLLTAGPSGAIRLWGVRATNPAPD